MRRNLIVCAYLVVSTVLVASCGGPAVSPVITSAPAASSTAVTSSTVTVSSTAMVSGTATVSGAATMSVTATPGGPGQTVNVTVRDFEFSPKALTVKKGTKVTWMNQGQAKHTVTSDDGTSFNSPINPGESFSFTFDKTGTFAYYCMFHGGPGGKGMSGTVVVQ